MTLSLRSHIALAALIATIALFFDSASFAREVNPPPDSASATLSGFVKDSASGETIIGATIRVRALKIGAVTNKSGFYTLHVPSGKPVLVEVSYLGYAPIKETMTFGVSEHRKRSFMLHEERIGKEITVETDRERERQEPQVSRVSINPQQVASLPKAGEADLFRILQFLPGVQTASEISSGLYIRGGSPDQNLIMLDGSVLYNPSHFFGFFSTFNPDAIKDVELIKGGFPAEYGSRLSAVLNVTDKDGDQNSTKGKVSLGLISSRATIETPVGSGALVLAGRRTYMDVVLDAAGLTKSLELPSYYFYDGNFKLTQNPSANDKLTAAGYIGSDHLSFTRENGGFGLLIQWGNKAASAQWMHIFSDELYSRLDLTASNFSSKFTIGSDAQPFTWDNGISDYTARASLEYFPTQEHTIKTGLQATSYRTILQIQSGDNPKNADIDRTPAYGAVYLQDEWKPTIDGDIPNPFAMTAGLRVDGVTSNPLIGIDPRLSLRYILTPEITLKASWGIYHQYLKLATNPAVPVFDVWNATDTTQSPQNAIQYVLGVSTVPFADFTLDIEGYYKAMHNLVEMKPNVMTGEKLSDVLFEGNGRSYGVEFFLQKQIGDWSGWLGYTLAWTLRNFPDINNGKDFAPTYDRRNDVNLVLSYRLNDRWTLGGSFTYGTGQAYTQIAAFAPDVENPEKTLPIEGDKNALRLPPYNRLDLSATYSFGFFSDKRNAELNVDIFNAYNYRNVWIAQVDENTNPATVSFVRLLPILPTVGLSVTF